MNSSHHSSSRPALRASWVALASAGLWLGAGTVQAAEDARSPRLEPQRAACLLNQPNANVEACVEERVAAREAAQKGELQDGAAYEKNALQRCRSLPAADQPLCEARIRGGGTATGSVEEGGILRELKVREPAGAAAARPPAPTRAQTGVTPAGVTDAVPANPATPDGPKLPR